MAWESHKRKHLEHLARCFGTEESTTLRQKQKDNSQAQALLNELRSVHNAEELRPFLKQYKLFPCHKRHIPDTATIGNEAR